MSSNHPFLAGTSTGMNGPAGGTAGTTTGANTQQRADDLAARTSNLAITDQPKKGASSYDAFPVQKSVWPTNYRSSQQPNTDHNRNTFAAFDVADRSFDKDPNLLKAEHERVAPGGLYHRAAEQQSPSHQGAPNGVANEGVKQGAAVGAGAGAGAGIGAGAGAQLIREGKEMLHPSSEQQQQQQGQPVAGAGVQQARQQDGQPLAGSGGVPGDPDFAAQNLARAPPSQETQAQPSGQSVGGNVGQNVGAGVVGGAAGGAVGHNIAQNLGGANDGQPQSPTGQARGPHSQAVKNYIETQAQPVPGQSLDKSQPLTGQRDPAQTQASKDIDQNQRPHSQAVRNYIETQAQPIPGQSIDKDQPLAGQRDPAQLQSQQAVDQGQRPHSEAVRNYVDTQAQPQPRTQPQGQTQTQNYGQSQPPYEAGQNLGLTQSQEAEPDHHHGAKAAGVGAGAGLAAATGAHMLAADGPREQDQQRAGGDYFGSKGGPRSPAPNYNEPSAHMTSNAPAQDRPTGGTFRRLSGNYVGGYSNGDASQLDKGIDDHDHDRYMEEATAANTAANAQYSERPQLNDQPSRSYINTSSPVTSYDRPLEGDIARRTSQRSSRPPSTKFVEHMNGQPPPQQHGSRLAVPGQMGGYEHHQPREDPFAHDGSRRPASAQDFGRRSSGQQDPHGPFSRPARPASAMAAPMPREGSLRGSARSPRLSPNASVRRHGRLPPIADDVAYAGIGAGGGLALGEVADLDRQHEMQYRGSQLADDGPVPPLPPGHRGARSPEGGRYSSFGHRPEPAIGDWRDRREEGRLARSGTALSRTTVGRSGTQRSRRSGAFGRGAGLSVGTQPEDVLGRDDIHERTELSERVLDPSTLRKLQGMEKKDARRLAKLLKAEGKEQARSVEGAIRDLKRMARMQKDAIESERKSQRGLAKWTQREHRARMRFLKEKERYEKVEGELRNAENDYEERRDHAAGLTAQIAEK